MTDAESLFHLYDRCGKAAFQKYAIGTAWPGNRRPYWETVTPAIRQVWREIAETVIEETKAHFADKDTATEKRATGRLD